MIKGLYLVEVSGFPLIPHAYVVAYGPTEAYDVVKRDLDARDIRFKDDRQLSSVTLVATDEIYPTGRDLPRLYF